MSTAYAAWCLPALLCTFRAAWNSSQCLISDSRMSSPLLGDTRYIMKRTDTNPMCERVLLYARAIARSLGTLTLRHSPQGVYAVSQSLKFHQSRHIANTRVVDASVKTRVPYKSHFVLADSHNHGNWLHIQWI